MPLEPAPPREHRSPRTSPVRNCAMMVPSEDSVRQRLPDPLRRVQEDNIRLRDELARTRVPAQHKGPARANFTKVEDDWVRRTHVEALQLAAETAQRTMMAMVECVAVVHSSIDPASKVAHVMKAVQSTLSCERSSLFLVDEVRDDLLRVGSGGKSSCARLPISGVAGHVVRFGEPVRVDSPDEDPRFDSSEEHEADFQTRSILAVPVRISSVDSSRVVGVLAAVNLLDDVDAVGFDLGHESLLQTIARQLLGMLPGLMSLLVETHETPSGMAADELQRMRGLLADEHGAEARGLATFHAHTRHHQAADVIVDVLRVGADRAGARDRIRIPAVLDAVHCKAEELCAERALRRIDRLGWLPPGVTLEELRSSWDLDFLSLGRMSLIDVAAAIMMDSGVVEQFSIQPAKLSNFLHAVSSRYRANAFHNFNHACHACHGCYLLMREQIRRTAHDEQSARASTPRSASSCAIVELSPLDRLALLLAAVCHDVDHPGRNNAFLVSTGHPLAITYNDTAVLENHHCATTFAILADHQCDVLETLRVDERRAVRKLMIAAIMATDMAAHKSMLRGLTQHAACGGHLMQPVEVVAAFCHLADLSSCASCLPLSREWAMRACDEATAQAAEERRLGQSTAIHNLDRPTEEELAARQLVFLDDWVLPLYSAAAVLFPGARGRLQQLHFNRERFREIRAGFNRMAYCRSLMPPPSANGFELPESRLQTADELPAACPLARRRAAQGRLRLADVHPDGRA